MPGLPRQKASRPGANPDGSSVPSAEGKPGASIPTPRRGRQRMNHTVEEWIYRSSVARGVSRAVLLVLARHAHWDTGRAWPSVATIAREARASERAVQYALRRLVSLGELTVEHRFAGGQQISSVYLFPQVSGLPTGRAGGVQILHRGGADSAPEGSTYTGACVTGDPK